MAVADLERHEIDSEIGRRERDETILDEADRLSRSFPEFIRAAWPYVVPVGRVNAWHIDCIAEHVQAAYEREITRLVVTIQPGSLKSSIVSVFGPAWRWATNPSERIVSASWGEHLSNRDTRRSRMLMQTPWYQLRWGDMFDLAHDENLKGRYSNDQNGHRIATYVGGGTGDRGDVLLIDDPHNAKEAQTENQLQGAIEWFGDTWVSRLNNPVDHPGVHVVVGQRIHENDLIAHLLELGTFHHLCLPARYEDKTMNHPHAPYPRTVTLRSGRTLDGDQRSSNGELLAPSYMNEEGLAELERTMTTHVAAGQLQQRPAAREGDLLKRAHWRYYPPRRDDETDADFVARLPKFRRLISSWDTPLKEKETSDLIAGQLYGEHGGDRYLLDLVQGHMNYSTAKRAVTGQHDFARQLWPDVRLTILIEKGGYGLDLARELAREITGVTQIPEKGERLPDKFTRAESASGCLESGNVFLPGYPSPSLDGPDEARSPSMTVGLVATCAAFPNGRYKDPVDAWSQAMNYLDKHRGGRPSISSPRNRTIGSPSIIPQEG